MQMPTDIVDENNALSGYIGAQNSELLVDAALSKFRVGLNERSADVGIPLQHLLIADAAL